MRCAGIVAPMSEMRNPYKILVGNHERKGPFTWPTRKSEGNIEMSLKEMGHDYVDWIHLFQVRDRLG